MISTPFKSAYLKKSNDPGIAVAVFLLTHFVQFSWLKDSFSLINHSLYVVLFKIVSSMSAIIANGLSCFFDSSISRFLVATLYACRHNALNSAEFLCQYIE